MARYGRGYKSPIEHFLRGSLLKEYILNVNAIRKIHEKTWKQHGCNLMLDGWTDRRGRSILNFLINSVEELFYLYSIDASHKEKTGPYLAQVLGERHMNLKAKATNGTQFDLIQVDKLNYSSEWMTGVERPSNEFVYEDEGLTWSMVAKVGG